MKDELWRGQPALRVRHLEHKISNQKKELRRLNKLLSDETIVHAHLMHQAQVRAIQELVMKFSCQYYGSLHLPMVRWLNSYEVGKRQA